MAVQPKPMTADELLRLPRDRDGKRHELVRGELRTMPPSGFEHGSSTTKGAMSLGNFVEAHGLGAVVAAIPRILMTIIQNNIIQRCP